MLWLSSERSSLFMPSPSQIGGDSLGLDEGEVLMRGAVAASLAAAVPRRGALGSPLYRIL